MENQSNRRAALRSLGLAAAGLTAMVAISARAAAQPAVPDLVAPGATRLAALKARLANAPRRRDFRTVPMILDDPRLWDHEALNEVIAYQGGPRQVWDNTDLDGGWLNLMRNAMNAQIWSYKHPDFIAVSATHGPAQLALFDQGAWDKYQFAKLGGKMTSNTLLQRVETAEADKDHQSDTGAYSGADNTVVALMDRGAVFLACHLAIWELSGKLIKQDVNPDHMSHEAMAADLTNRLAPGVILTPGMVATIPELQQAGYHYIA